MKCEEFGEKFGEVNRQFGEFKVLRGEIAQLDSDKADVR